MPEPQENDALEKPVLVEYKGIYEDGEYHNTSTETLYVDKENNQIGLKDVFGGRVYLPLSDVLELLKRGVI